jgi:hypothetical protein
MSPLSLFRVARFWSRVRDIYGQAKKKINTLSFSLMRLISLVVINVELVLPVEMMNVNQIIVEV